MNNQFNLKKTELSNYPFISFSVDYCRLDEYLNDVCSQLQEYQFSGKILFDLVISNGLSNNRFYEAYFDGKEFISSSFERKTELPNPILKIANDFYAKHLDVLDKSVLTKPQKFLFKRMLLRKNLS